MLDGVSEPCAYSMILRMFGGLIADFNISSMKEYSRK